MEDDGFTSIFLRLMGHKLWSWTGNENTQLVEVIHQTTNIPPNLST